MNRQDLVRFITNKKVPIMVQSKFKGGYRFIEVNRAAYKRLLNEDFSATDEVGVDPIVKNDRIWMEMNSSAEH